MCSIHGWYAWGDKRPDPIALRGMLLCGAERGGTAPNYSNDATGVAYQKDGEIRIIKDNGKAKDFVNKLSAEQWASIAASPRGLMHNRARTKGAISDPNNHPLDAFGWVAVHNGTISNDDDLFGHFKIKRPAEVDSIAIPLVLSQGKDYLDSLKQLSVLSGGVTTAMWKIEQMDTIAIGRWGPNELYLWWVDDIVYWSSAYASSVYMGHRNMGSLRFQTMTRMPEDRILVLSPEKARTFNLKRRPFLMPLDELKAYRASITTTPAPSPAGTTGHTSPSATKSTTWPPDRGSYGGTRPQQTLPLAKTSGTSGSRWKWAPITPVVNKPVPIAEQIASHFLSRDDVLKAMEAKGVPAYVTVPTAYGTWHWSSMALQDNEVKTVRWFKPARRTKPFWQTLYGSIPVLPVIRDGQDSHAFDGKLPLERFFIIEHGHDGRSVITPGYMCPVCGLTQSTSTWAYWSHMCKWCMIKSVLPMGGSEQ